MIFREILLGASFFGVVLPLFGVQEPRLVADVNTGGQFPQIMGAAGDDIYFLNDVQDAGRSLWSYNVESGVLRRASPEPETEAGCELTETVYFTDNCCFILLKREIWSVRDGGQPVLLTGGIGNVMEVDISHGDFPVQTVRDRLIFSEYTNESGNASSLWTSDGTPEGTRPLVQSSEVLTPAALLEKLHEGLAFFSDGTYNIASTYATDGETAWKLADDSRDFMPYGFLVDSGGSALTNSSRGKVVEWDGTNLIASSVTGDLADAVIMGAAGGRVIARAAATEGDWEPWAYDPADKSWTLLKDIVLGAEGSWATTENPGPMRDSAYMDLLARVASVPGDGSCLAFAAWNPDTGWEPYVTDGTPVGTRLIADIEPGAGDSSPTGFCRVGRYLCFRACKDWVNSIYVYDPENGSLRSMHDLYTGYPELRRTFLTAFRDRLYFQDRDDKGAHLGILDPATGAVSLVDLPDSLNWSSLPFQANSAGDKVLFFASGLHLSPLRELYLYDPETRETTLIRDNFLRPQFCGLYEDADRPLECVEGPGGAYYFAAVDPIVGPELWRTNFTYAGTQALGAAQILHTDPDYDPWDPDLKPRHFVRVGEKLFFLANFRELWVTDGSVTGTHVVDLPPSSEILDLAALDADHALVVLSQVDAKDEQFFSAWTVDQEGTFANRVAVLDGFLAGEADITARPGGVLVHSAVYSDISTDYLTLIPPTGATVQIHGTELFYRGLFYFVRDRAAYAWEAGVGLHRLDLASGAVSTPVPFGANFQYVSELAETDSGIVFLAPDGNGITNLWRLDDAAGSQSRMILSGEPYQALGGIYSILYADDRAVFLQLPVDSFHLPDLACVRDDGCERIYSSVSFRWVLGLGGEYFFSAPEGLYTTDGTRAGTHSVLRTNSGFYDMNDAGIDVGPLEMRILGGRLYFTLFRRPTGREMYVVEASGKGWFGPQTENVSGSGWDYHYLLGWLYPMRDGQALWFYSPAEGWFYTDKGYYAGGYLYRYSDESWLYVYRGGSADNRWYYNFKTGDYEHFTR